MVADPGEHRWSSYRANARNEHDLLVTPHARYLALGPDSAARSQAYRALFDEVMTESTVTEIRAYLQQQKALGSNRFRDWIEARTGRFASVRASGRPAARSYRDSDCP